MKRRIKLLILSLIFLINTAFSLNLQAEEINAEVLIMNDRAIYAERSPLDIRAKFNSMNNRMRKYIENNKLIYEGQKAPKAAPLSAASVSPIDKKALAALKDSINYYRYLAGVPAVESIKNPAEYQVVSLLLQNRNDLPEYFDDGLKQRDLQRIKAIKEIPAVLKAVSNSEAMQNIKVENAYQADFGEFAAKPLKRPYSGVNKIAVNLIEAGVKEFNIAYTGQALFSAEKSEKSSVDFAAYPAPAYFPVQAIEAESAWFCIFKPDSFDPAYLQVEIAYQFAGEKQYERRSIKDNNLAYSKVDDKIAVFFKAPEVIKQMSSSEMPILLDKSDFDLKIEYNKPQKNRYSAIAYRTRLFDIESPETRAVAIKFSDAKNRQSETSAVKQSAAESKRQNDRDGKKPHSQSGGASSSNSTNASNAAALPHYASSQNGAGLNVLPLSWNAKHPMQNPFAIQQLYNYYYSLFEFVEPLEAETEAAASENAEEKNEQAPESEDENAEEEPTQAVIEEAETIDQASAAGAGDQKRENAGNEDNGKKEEDRGRRGRRKRPGK